MPIYEYQCQKCQSNFEYLAKSMGQTQDKVPCPECGSTRTAKKFSTFAVGSANTSSKELPCQQAGACGCRGGAGCPMMPG